MAKQTINIGQTANDKTGDPLRTAFSKVNENFTELYATVGAGGDYDRLTSGDAELVLTGGNNPFVTFPANGTDQLFIQGSEIAATSGSIALTSLDGRIILTTHGDLAPALSWEFDRSGTLTTPLGLPKTFTAVLDTEHAIDNLTLTGAAWEFDVSFQVNPNGEVETLIGNNMVYFNNPGYAENDSFTFAEADHGIPGFVFEMAIINLQQTPAGWTRNFTVTQPPTYPSTISSLGAIKLTADTNSWVLGTDGTLTLPVGGDIQDSNGNSVLNTTIDGGNASSSF